ncbi:hypothetical protein ASG31_01710 [Chryseobacterium sp. Leaf404]|uniref:hypothetical protein n=1 Tax=unclassified Chryseobacterium TaxID=2593645 RepID=UPI0006F4F68F|nr:MULTISPECIES: hypothetical protein [unclassified Chryseobacterium]KQT22082.1 hypothetical protein ASG31_01710 [Chryseobacterium sp. Leaf404]
MKIFAKYFSVIFGVYIALCFLLKKEEANVDGFNQFGFPFVFYRQFYGKCTEYKYSDFIMLNLLLDLSIVVIFSVIIFSVMKKKNR